MPEPVPPLRDGRKRAERIRECLVHAVVELEGDIRGLEQRAEDLAAEITACRVRRDRLSALADLSAEQFERVIAAMRLESSDV